MARQQVGRRICDCVGGVGLSRIETGSHCHRPNLVYGTCCEREGRRVELRRGRWGCRRRSPIGCVENLGSRGGITQCDQRRSRRLGRIFH